MLKQVIERRKIDGVPRRVVSPARTIVDCFRYRNKLRIHVAADALREVLRSRSATVLEITRAPVTCRARAVLKTDLEVLAP
jgi:hypothetical protein